MNKYLNTMLVVLLMATPVWAAQKSAKQQAPATQQNWYDNLIFKDEGFSFEFARTAGYAYSGGADLGESISTGRAIKNADTNSWYQQWLATADRLNTVGQQMETDGHTVSAREVYFRASNYYRSAGLYMVAVNDRPKSISAYAASKNSFLRGIASLPYVKQISIPYEKTTLPGYFLKAEKKSAPLLIVHTGFDGTAEELYFETALAAYKRGYNVLIFEGPGQGSVLRQQNLPFRYDWEKVVTPVIDYAMTLPDFNKDKVALMGISMGGYLAARACAFDGRIKACILNGGIYDQAASIYAALPPDLIALLKTNPAQFNQDIYDEMRKHLTTRWFFDNAMWSFAASSPYEVLQKLQSFTLKDVITQIKCPTLVIDSEQDLFYKGQPQEVYDALKSPKTLLKFTVQETAQAHCQMGAIAISNEKIYDWLDKTFQ